LYLSIIVLLKCKPLELPIFIILASIYIQKLKQGYYTVFTLSKVCV
jgi:hypothetical protein